MEVPIIWFISCLELELMVSLPDLELSSYTPVAGVSWLYLDKCIIIFL